MNRYVDDGRPAPSGLFDFVVDELGRRIVGEQLGAGTVLVPADLCEELGVSRSVLREAFRVLQTKGLLSAKTKLGTVVSPSSAWDYLDPRIVMWRLGGPGRDEQIAEIFELRLTVEPAAARLVAESHTPEVVAQLRAHLAEMRAAMDAGDLVWFARADASFHGLLVGSSGNRMMAALQDVVEIGLRAREVVHIPFSESAAAGIELHEQLVDHIERGTADSEELAREMLRAARSEMLTAIATPTES